MTARNNSIGEPSQRDVINLMQGQMIGLGKDMEYLKKQADSTDKKLDGLGRTVGALTFTPLNDFNELKRRVEDIETNLSKNSLGLRLSNDVASNIFRFVAMTAAVALLFLAAQYVRGGGR